MHPERLSASDLIGPDAPFRIQHTTLAELYPLHWHDFYELAIVLRGHGLHTVNGLVHSLHPDTVFLLTPVDFHCLQPEAGQSLEIFNIVFGGTFLDDELRQWLFTGQKYHHFSAPPDLAECLRPEFERIWVENQGSGLGRERIMRSSLEKILLEVARHTQGEAGLAEAGHSAIHNALLYLHHQFRTPLTLESVARQAGLASTYFSQVFHKVTGVQFQKYLSNLRLRFAASLLLTSTQLPITEICFASGFGNMANFGRAFRAKYGLSPGLYRRQKASDRLPGKEFV